ncbi:uncharacterized protein LOC143485725 [Brachyhypopomus gauderio]|uniref:uncharacterized protein LOC143485725 n=1 Tax=Brachyhypopomus gauderio TaxID=698409 RepID=UPI004040F086
MRQVVLPPLVTIPGHQSSSTVSVKSAHTPAAPHIPGQAEATAKRQQRAHGLHGQQEQTGRFPMLAALQPKRSNTPVPANRKQRRRTGKRPAVPGNTLLAVPGTVEDQARKMKNEAAYHRFSFLSRVDQGEVYYQDLESLTPVSQCGPKPEASHRQHDLIHHEPLLARRAALQKVKCTSLHSAPLKPNQLPQLSRVHVPLICQDQGQPKRKGKRQGGKAGSKCPAIPILTKGPELDVLTSYIRSQQNESVPDVNPNGASKIVTLGLPHPLPLQPAAVKVRRSRRL